MFSRNSCLYRVGVKIDNKSVIFLSLAKTIFFLYASGRPDSSAAYRKNLCRTNSSILIYLAEGGVRITDAYSELGSASERYGDSRVLRLF